MPQQFSLKTSSRFKRAYDKLSRPIQKKAQKQLNFLKQDPHYPSLQVKKMKGYDNIWEGRVDLSYRFTFELDGSEIILRNIGRHDETLSNP